MKKIFILIGVIFFLYISYNSFNNLDKIKDYFSNTYIEDNLNIYVISINDTKYNLNIKGDMEDTISIKLPYNISNSELVKIKAYEKSVFLNEKDSRENEKNVKLTFFYPEQTISGKGYIKAFLKINDKGSTIPDNKFKPRQLEIENENEYVLAEFIYPRNLKYTQYGKLKIEVISGIKDRMFEENNKYVYYPILSPITGKYWLNNNLGSYYSDIKNSIWKKNPLQQSKSIIDKNAFGNLFQWGRKSDGHELRYKFSNKFFTQIKSDNPNNDFFIVSNNYPFDWRENEDNTLWNGINGKNNVCPIGWRLPTNDEFLDEFASTSNNNFLKLTLAGYKLNYDNSIISENLYGNYWTSDVEDSYARFFSLQGGEDINSSIIYKTAAFSVRCIKG